MIDKHSRILMTKYKRQNQFIFTKVYILIKIKYKKQLFKRHMNILHDSI